MSYPYFWENTVLEATGPLDSDEACTWLEFTDASDEALEASVRFLLVRDAAAGSCAALPPLDCTSCDGTIDENKVAYYKDLEPDSKGVHLPRKPAGPPSTGPGIPVVFDHSWSHILDPTGSLTRIRWDD